LQPPGTIQMGERNVHASREALHRHGIRLTGEVVGGDYGRSVELDIESGVVRVTSYLHGTMEL
jgi:chemotaxis protein CheD